MCVCWKVKCHVRVLHVPWTCRCSIILYCSHSPFLCFSSCDISHFHMYTLVTWHVSTPLSQWSLHLTLAITKLQSKALPQVVWSSHIDTHVHNTHTHISYYCFLNTEFFMGNLVQEFGSTTNLNTSSLTVFKLSVSWVCCTLLHTVLPVLIHQFLFREVSFNLFYLADLLHFWFTLLSLLSALIYQIYYLVLLFAFSSPVQPSAVCFRLVCCLSL